MKKLTNKTDTFNALDKFGLEMQGEDLITSKGNLKGEAVDEEQLEKRINEVYEYWQTEGFPYYNTYKTWRQEKMAKLRAVDCKNLLTKDKVIKPHQEGLSLAWSYMLSLIHI